MKNGKLIVISGASGVGKGTVLSLMMQKRDDLFFSVSTSPGLGARVVAETDRKSVV